MAAIVHGHANAVTTNLTAYTSTAFTPAAGDLLVVFVVSGATLDPGVMTGSVVTTFTKIDHAAYNTNAARIFAFVANMVTTATSQTVTFTLAADAADGCLFMVARASGMARTGASAVRQSAKQENQAAGTPAPSFGSAVLTANATLGGVGNTTNPATIVTPPSGWTERADSGYGTPATGGEYVTRDSGFTGTTVTWGSASASVFGAIIVELDTSAVTEAPVPILVTGARRG